MKRLLKAVLYAGLIVLSLPDVPAPRAATITDVRLATKPEVTIALGPPTMTFTVVDGASPIQGSVAPENGVFNPRATRQGGLSLPEPGRWSAAIATLALVAFFFARRLPK